MAIVDARSGASGVIGEDEAVVAGARYRLARPLAAADVIGGQTLISLCVGQPAQVNEASPVSIAGEDAADRDSPNAAASQPVRLSWRVLGAAVLAAIGGWLGAGLLFWRASIHGEANPTTPRDDIDARVRRSRAGVARLWRTMRGMIATGLLVKHERTTDGRGNHYYNFTDMTKAAYDAWQKRKWDREMARARNRPADPLADW